MSQNETEDQNTSTVDSNLETVGAEAQQQQVLDVPEDAGMLSFEAEPSETDPDEGDPDFPIQGE